MSVEYNFQIKLVEKGGKKIVASNIIDCLVSSGWGLFSNDNNIIYTDIGDNDNFNFVAKNIDQDDFYKIVDQKQMQGETIALAMFYLESNCKYRIDVIITSDLEVIVSPDDLTKKMLSDKIDLLDVNWYFSKILPNLTNKKMSVESFSFCKY